MRISTGKNEILVRISASFEGHTFADLGGKGRNSCADLGFIRGKTSADLGGEGRNSCADLGFIRGK